MLKNYLKSAKERASQGIPPLPLDAEETHELTLILENPPTNTNNSFLLNLLRERIPPGVDQAAYVKATWLSSIAKQNSISSLVSAEEATKLLGTMVGGYNVSALIEINEGKETQLASIAAQGVSQTH